MLKRYWVVIASLGLTLSFGAPSLGQPASVPDQVVGEPRTAPSAEERPQEPAPQQQTANPAPPVIQELLPPPGSQEAAEGAEECDAACKREIEDLNAQKEMVYAAWAMFWATVIGVGIGGFSLFLIWRTVVYARDAAQAARDAVGEAEKATIAARDAVVEAKDTTRIAQMAYEADVRPLLKIAVKNTIQCAIEATGIEFEASIDLHNVGKGVAVQVVLSCHVLKLDSWDMDPALIQSTLDAFGRFGGGPGFAVFPNDAALGNMHVVREAIDANNPLSLYRDKILVLLVMVTYRGINTDEVYATTQAYFGTAVNAKIIEIGTAGTDHNQSIRPSPMPASMIVR